MAPSGVPQVAIAGMSWGALGSWATFLAVVGGIAGLVRAIGLARIVELILNRNRELRGEKLAEDTTLLSRVIALEEQVQRSSLIAMHLTGAISLTIGALRAIEADHPAIAQANALIEQAVAAGGDNAFAKSLAKLANVPNTKQ